MPVQLPAQEAALQNGAEPQRGMRKTLSRKSPFLPEVLPATIDYADIVFCEEDARKVLLGEGSFGQVGPAGILGTIS